MNEFDDSVGAEGVEIPEGESGESTGKKKSAMPPAMMAIIGVIVIVMAVGSHFLVKMLFFSKPPAPKVEKTTEGPAVGDVYKLESLIVNPRDTGGRRHLLIEIGFEVSDPVAITELETIDPLLRDNLLTFFSAQKTETLTDIHLRDKIKEKVKEIANFNLTTGEVTKVYFIRYVFQ